MSKYSLYATKQDYQKAYSRLKEIEQKLETTDKKTKLDWKKIKRSDLDSLLLLISIHEHNIEIQILNYGDQGVLNYVKEILNTIKS